MLAFVDESGHPHPNDSTERPVLVAVCFSESESHRISRQIFALKRRFLSSPHLELHARTILNERTYRRVPEKREFIEQVFDQIRQLPMAIFGVVMEKPQHVFPQEDGLLPKHYRFLLERINRHCQDEFPSERAILVFDGQDEGNDRKLSIAINNFLFRSNVGRTLERVVDTPFFVSSSIVTGIQLADLVAAVIRRYHEGANNGTGFFDAAIQRYHKIIQEKTIHFENQYGGIDFGIYIAPDDFFGVAEEQNTGEDQSA